MSRNGATVRVQTKPVYVDPDQVTHEMERVINGDFLVRGIGSLEAARRVIAYWTGDQRTSMGVVTPDMKEAVSNYLRSAQSAKETARIIAELYENR